MLNARSAISSYYFAILLSIPPGKERELKLIFNDATELTIQSATIRTDGSLLIKSISATEEELRTMFQDAFKTKKMTVTERESTVATYENYTNLNALVKYIGGILGVVIYKSDETPEDKLEALKKENDELKANMDMLQGCILEMSELVYQ